MFYGAYISTCNWGVKGCIKQIGLANYTKAFSDPEMWHSLLVTATYSILSVPLQLGISLLLAYLLFQKIRGKAIYRVFFFMPYITATVASASVWAFLYSPDKGLINEVAGKLGLPQLRWLMEPRGIFEVLGKNLQIPIPLELAGPSLAMLAIILYTTWVFVGYDTVIFLAGLGNIPNELYEAAKIDGASGWQLFRRITIPLLSPTTFFLLALHGHRHVQGIQPHLRHDPGRARKCHDDLEHLHLPANVPIQPLRLQRGAVFYLVFGDPGDYDPAEPLHQPFCGVCVGAREERWRRVRCNPRLPAPALLLVAAGHLLRLDLGRVHRHFSVLAHDRDLPQDVWQRHHRQVLALAALRHGVLAVAKLSGGDRGRRLG